MATSRRFQAAVFVTPVGVKTIRYEVGQVRETFLEAEADLRSDKAERLANDFRRFFSRVCLRVDYIEDETNLE